MSDTDQPFVPDPDDHAPPSVTTDAPVPPGDAPTEPSSAATVPDASQSQVSSPIQPTNPSQQAYPTPAPYAQPSYGQQSYPPPATYPPPQASYPPPPPAYPQPPATYPPPTAAYPAPPAYAPYPSTQYAPAPSQPLVMPIAMAPMMVVTPIAVPAPTPARPADPGSGVATAGLVLGILGLVFCWLLLIPVCDFLELPLPILGLIFGLVGLRSRTRRGSAITGIVTSLVTFAIFGLIVAGFVASLGVH